MDYQTKSRKKENILTKLKRLMPGCSAGINAMSDKEGNVTTDPKEIAKLLRDHWAETFRKRGIGNTKMNV